MRPRRQDERRRQLVEAARRVLLERGAVGLRVKDVADHTGLAPSTVLYYYPEIEDLLLEVGSGAMSRYAERRAEAVRSVEGPVARLRLAIHLGIPSGPDDDQSRLLYEIDALTGTSHAFDVLSATFFDRQVSLYEGILEAGETAGDFELTAPAPRLARGLVAMEDGLGLQVVIGHPAIETTEAERILLDYAGAATGVDLAGDEPAPTGASRPPSRSSRAAAR
jgi:AcrR family transcriptional regulator